MGKQSIKFKLQGGLKYIKEMLKKAWLSPGNMLWNYLFIYLINKSAYYGCNYPKRFYSE